MDAAELHRVEGTSEHVRHQYGFPLMRYDAVLLDVGGIFHLPAHHRIGAALERAGIASPEVLDRAHYAGVAAITDFTDGDRDVWMAYQPAYAARLRRPRSGSTRSPSCCTPSSCPGACGPG